MKIEEFLEVLDILEEDISDDSLSNILKNSFKRTPYPKCNISPIVRYCR